MGDDATIVLKNIKDALQASELEALNSPPGLLAIGGGINGQIFDLSLGETILGRSDENGIALDIAGISRKHVRITVNKAENEQFTVSVEDLQSKNGTFVNDRKIEGPHELRKGDIIKVGSVALKYLPKGDPERATFDKLNLEAITDPLTGCYNKAFYLNNISKYFNFAQKNGTPLSLLIFDIDHFKKLNDTYGHDAGDFVLKEFAKLITTQGIRRGDIFARYGGEEFVLILPNTNIKTAFDIGERNRKIIENQIFNYQKKEIRVTVSIGLSDYRPGVTNYETLFKRADSALYKSKEGGRNQVTFYRE